MSDTLLLCTFSDANTFETTVETILQTVTLYSDKIFILKMQPSNELVISYNVVMSPQLTYVPNTITVHRKKETNTIYTINALNKLIVDLNDGILNRNYVIDWDSYKNSIILTNGDGYKIMSTTLFRILSI